MIYQYTYKTKKEFSDIIMNSDGTYLTSLYFKDFRTSLNDKEDYLEEELPIFKETSLWLDIYFSGEKPNFIPQYKIENLTPFREEVMNIISTIPYGKTLTYGDISKRIEKRFSIKKMSSQAVGGAVSRNPIWIIIPCHRVVGVHGNLTGYGGGMQNKIALLAHEKNDMTKYFIPKKGTKL